MADTTVNRLVIDRVKSEFPDHGILGEEENFNGDKSSVWVVDPVDGTDPFARGIPVSVFSIAYVEDGEAKVGVVYDPFTKRLYTAKKGGGAFENDRRLDVADHQVVGRRTIANDVQGATGWSIFANADIYGKVENALNTDGKTAFYQLPYVQAAVMVAAGRLEAFISSNTKPWDFAAAGLIAAEAGAKVTDIFGEPIPRADRENRGCCIASPAIHDEIMSVIKPLVESAKTK